MQLVNSEVNDMVLLAGSEVITTSFKVAEYFNKRHANVLRTIKNLGCSDEFAKLNFELCYEINELQNSKPRPFYKMTKDGWMMLVMGFTGEQAMLIKEMYIAAFNGMAKVLQNSRQSMMDEMNRVMLEFMKEKDVASMSGRLLRRWGKEKKPQLMARIEQLKDDGQLKLIA